jgi:hypothetical protein
MKLRPAVLLASMLVLSVVGCGGGQGDTAASHLTDHHDDHHDDEAGWEDIFEEMPTDVGAATQEVAESLGKMAKEFTDLPAPGKVELKDLSPELAAFQGKKGQDYLTFAHDAAGKALPFQYARLGVADFDAFFKNVEELHALVYQATQTVANMKRISSKILGTKVEPGPDFKAAVDKALAGKAPASQIAELKALEQMSKVLAKLLPDAQARVAKLVASGEALIAGAPGNVANPKIVANIGTVKDGMGRSVKLAKSSGTMLAKAAGDLASFK